MTATASLRGWNGLLVLTLVAMAVAVAALRVDFGPAPEVSRFRDDAYYFFSWARPFRPEAK